jgi:hypothetical protein
MSLDTDEFGVGQDEHGPVVDCPTSAVDRVVFVRNDTACGIDNFEVWVKARGEPEWKEDFLPTSGGDDPGNVRIRRIPA